jgi:hypothetical protein
MNTEEFRKYWHTHHQDTLPLGHELRLNYNDRWLRIHSLPDAKRYAENEEEYSMILIRQNTFISDLFSNHPDFVMLMAVYSNDVNINEYRELDNTHKFLFTEKINLHRINPNEYEAEDYLDIYIKEAKWVKYEFDPMLRKMADDELQMLFINASCGIIIAPYDGGTDIIFKDVFTKEGYKSKYRDWLSNREDGL